MAYSLNKLSLTNSSTGQNPIRSIQEQKDCLLVHWNDGENSQFDYLWLRDNCSSCFHPSTLERNFRLLSIPEDIKPINVTLHQSSLEIYWSNQDRSVFSYDWLRDNDYSNSKITQLPKNNCQKWGSGYAENIHRVDYQDFANNDQLLYEKLLNESVIFEGLITD